MLVTDQDGVPVSKVIDFGIAKATEGRLTDRTLFTAFEQFLGTPAYMSPEQAAMTSGDIDTRSDIYSLGVLLYELLTGRTPFDTQKLLSSGIDEIRRTIRDQDPVRPSTRLSTMTGADLTAIAKCRKVEPPRLIHLVKGDLDWIVMKALEKDRALRYETANGLAADVQRHLKNEPVVARPPGNFYRLQKLVRRNKLAFAAAALMAVVLVTATGVSVRQADLARQRLVESEAITKFLTQVFQSPDPSRDGRTITVAETLQAALATTYHGLGLDQEAIPLQEKVRDYYLSIAGLEDPNTLKAMHSLALSYVATGRRAEALQLQEQVLKLRLKVLGPENPDTLWAMNNLSFSYDEANRREEAFKLREQALALRRKVNGPEHPDTLWAMNTLAFSYDDLGRWNEALKLREETCALCLKVLGPEHPSTLLALQCLAYSYYELDRRDEALKLQEDLVNTLRRVSGPEHPATLWVMHDLAVSYSDAGRLQEALAMQEQVLALRRKLLGPENFNTIWTMHTMASTLDALGRRDEALKLREQVLALRLKTGGPEQPSTLSAMGNLAISYEEAGRGEEAIKLREQTLAGRRKVLAPGHPDTLEAMGEMAKSYASAGREKEALSLLEQVCAASPKDAGAALALAAWQNWFGHEADYEATRGRAVQQAEGTDRASTAGYAAKAACLKPSADAALLEKALNLAHRSAEFGKSSSFLPTLQLDLGLAEYRKGQFTNAERTLTTAEQSMRGSPELLGTARLLRAMSMFREGRPEEARKLFSQAEAQIPPLPRDESKPRVDGGQVDQNFVICWMAYKEAKALIEPPSTAALK